MTHPTTHPTHADLGGLLDRLGAAAVDFLVVGGAAAVLHGAPTSTVDLDIVPSLARENLARLFALLLELEAELRDPGLKGRPLSLEQLPTAGQLRLLTSLGPLDVLARLHDGRDYNSLVEHCVAFTDGKLKLRVIDLPTLIEIKAATGRARDKLLVPLLLALQREREGRAP